MREGFEQTGNIQQISTGYLQVANGTTAQRPIANNGMIRYNTDYGNIETYISGSWSNNLTVTGSVSSGQVLFSNGITAAGDSNFLWDNTNKRLGVGGTPLYPLDVYGNAIVARLGTSGDTTVRSTGTGLIFEQTGDLYGTSRLSIVNRTAENGAIFETTDNTATVVDFIFKTATTQRNLRFEARSTYYVAGSPSFHIGGISPDTPTLGVGDNEIVVAGSVFVGNSGIIASPAGSAASPTYTFQGETTKGMFSPSSGKLAFSAISNTIMTIDGETAGANSSVIFNMSDSITLPNGTTAQRPSTPTYGMLRHNSNTNTIELYSKANNWDLIDKTYINASRAPLVTDDIANGFSIGTTWQYSNYTFHCSNNAVGAALWQSVDEDQTQHPGFFKTTPSYYGPMSHRSATVATATFATGTIYYLPFYVGPRMTFTRFGAEVTTLLAAGTARMAIYYNNYALGCPGQLLVDGGTVSVATTGAKEYTTATTNFNQQIYWLAIQFSGNVGMRSLAATSADPWLGRLTSSGTGIQCFTATATYAAYTTTPPGTLAPVTTNPPFLWLRNV